MYKKTTFALFFGNRGFFPGELIADARKEMIKAVTDNGFDYICMDESLTRYGAVETRQEGKLYASFLKENEGKFDGVILCLPNFGDENGAVIALKEANVPVLVQAYPDEDGKMDFAHRRDALCGKIAMCNMLRQCKIKYTLTSKTAVSPLDESFASDLKHFAAVCRVVKNLKSFNIGAIGARTTAFKTVRTDEIAMENKGITIETIDMSVVFDMMNKADADKVSAKKEKYLSVTSFGNYPDEKAENMAKLGVAIDELIEEYNLQAVAVRCWDELEKIYKIAPCLVMSELNERGIPAACELDINNAVMMYALQAASEAPVMLLDVNNNYNSEANKCIMFHCSAIPHSFFDGSTNISEHLMFKKSYGEGTGVGIVNGKIKTGEVTIGSFKTEDGALCAFAADGKLTEDKIQKEFFGCGCVFENERMENILTYMCENGYRHHVAIAHGKWSDAIAEAMNKYLEYKADIL